MSHLLFRWHFPPSEQELTNLRQYTQDVSQIVSPVGNHLQLDISMLYLWCADYKKGSPDTTLGECGMDFESYNAAILDSINGIINAVRGIYRVVHQVVHYLMLASKETSICPRIRHWSHYGVKLIHFTP